MAVHRGLSLQAVLALTTGCSDISRCTGTVGIAEAKCSRSITIRRGKDKGMNFPRNLCLRELQQARNHLRANLAAAKSELRPTRKTKNTSDAEQTGRRHP